MPKLTRRDIADIPFLDEFRRESLYYSEMHSTATTTTPCVASLLTGCYSERNGVNSHHDVDLSPEVTTLAEEFGEMGYNSYAMVTGPLVEETGLNKGFDEYWYRERNKNLSGEWGESAVERVKGLEEPYFLYLHLWELHAPIQVPDEYDDPDYGDLSAPHAQKYARSLSALDRNLERFVGTLPKETIIALTGDHGEHLTGWERPLYSYIIQARDRLRYDYQIDARKVEQAVNRVHKRVTDPRVRDHFFEEGHGHNTFDAETNVPFLLSRPGGNSTTVEAQVRQIDVYPTLLEAASIPTPETPESESLLPVSELEDRDAYIRACGPPHKIGHSVMRAIRDGRYKYIEFPERDWSPELYDTNFDEWELRPITDVEVQAELSNKLPDEGLHDQGDIGVDELLEDLGYL